MKKKNDGSSLRKVRTLAEGFFLLGLSVLLMGAGSGHFAWMAKVQLVPAVSRALADATLLNLAVVLLLIALALLFGRIYCSTLCPLGAFQDLIIRVCGFVRRRILRKKPGGAAFRFRKQRRWLRYGVLAIYVVCFVAAFQPVIALLAPYSSYGRILHAFHPAVSVVGAVSFAVIVLLTCLGGRLWCNLFCPVGTFLGLLSRKAVFRMRIDGSKCVSCGLCVRHCKASCIDIAGGRIDSSRCVVCFDCLDSCDRDAIHYGPAPKPAGRKAPAPGDPNASSPEPADKGRRKFMTAGAALTAAVLVPEVLSADNEGRPARKTPARKSVPVPPGAGSVKHMYERCTACQLCISACPNGVLRPSTDLTHLMVPEMYFDKGWCRPECNTCSSVCPAGAILPLEKGEKLSVSIGIASVDRQRCVVNTDGVACGNCARHCPAGAIRMVETDGWKKRQPVVDESLCIGCGACEYLCPARPEPAIVVSGRSVHSRMD